MPHHCRKQSREERRLASERRTRAWNHRALSPFLAISVAIDDALFCSLLSLEVIVKAAVGSIQSFGRLVLSLQ
ncbi:hypothetical protein AHAS_Ahas16G0171900 [Arachis hypogaea]